MSKSRLTEEEFQERADLWNEVMGDIADEKLQAIYDFLKEAGAPEAEIEAARIKLDTSINAMIEERFDLLLGRKKRETKH
jgi:hypothetical protein